MEQLNIKQLFELIGRQQVEIDLLQTKVAELQNQHATALKQLADLNKESEDAKLPESDDQ